MRRIIMLWSALLPLLCGAQVVNTEVKRLNTSREGWVGQANFTADIVRNTRNLFKIGTDINVQYRKKKNTLFLMSNFNILRADQDAFVNRGFGHVRFNHEWKRFLIPEAFVQAQFDEIQWLEMRLLAGTGPRIRIVSNDTARVYLGVMYMFEYEKVINDSVFVPQHRMSSYFSVQYAVTKTLTLNHITYWQPNLAAFGDFRISSDTRLTFSLAEWLAFSFGYNFLFDTKPPVGLDAPLFYYTLQNGVAFKF